MIYRSCFYIIYISLFLYFFTSSPCLFFIIIYNCIKSFDSYRSNLAILCECTKPIILRRLYHFQYHYHYHYCYYYYYYQHPIKHIQPFSHLCISISIMSDLYCSLYNYIPDLGANAAALSGFSVVWALNTAFGIYTKQWWFGGTFSSAPDWKLVDTLPERWLTAIPAK